MKFSITKNFKKWIIATLIVLVVGMFVLGFAGLNKPIDYRTNYQIKIDVNENISSSVEIARDEAEKFFKENGLEAIGYSVVVGDDGAIIYKFNNDVTKKVDGLKIRIEQAFASKSISSDVKVLTRKSVAYVSNDTLAIALATGISIVAIFVYLLIMEKLASALAVLGSSIISAILFVAFTAITRAPLTPFFVSGTALSALVSAVLSMLFISRIRSAVKNVANEKLSNNEIADMCFTKVMPSFIGVFATVLVSALLFVIFGTGYLKYLGIQLAIGGVCATFSAGAWTPLIWSALRKGKPSKKPTVEEE